ncbi:MAG: GNAT family N-acetyltransferase [Phycisphaerae bacterium]
MPAFQIRPSQADDRRWIVRLLVKRWHSTEIVTRGRTHRADRLPGFVAEVERQPVGLLTYHITAGQCEIVSLDSLRAGSGIGTALLDAVRAAARVAGCRRMWLITTNDNRAALRFYQKRGWRLVAIHRDALAEARRLKPEIPPTGIDGIPLRDELELQILL